jgi:hypothetical protein
MDLNDLRSGVTVLGLLLFLVLVVRTWRPGRRADHEAAARAVFDGEDTPPSDAYLGRSPETMRAGSGAARRSTRPHGAPR